MPISEWAKLPVGEKGKPLADKARSSEYKRIRIQNWCLRAGYELSDWEATALTTALRHYNKDSAKDAAPGKHAQHKEGQACDDKDCFCCMGDECCTEDEAELDSGDSQKVTSKQQGDVIHLAVEGTRITSLDALLKAAKVDPAQWDVETWVANTYEAQRKGGSVVQLWQVKASLRRKPTWLLKRAKEVDYTPKAVAKPNTKVKTCLVIPDSQNGYRWDDRYEYLAPLHDRLAWDVTIQVAQSMQPDRIDLLGDMVDVANLSTRYTRHPNLKHTTQPTIDELHWWLAQLRKACPESQIYYHCGNHEDRLDRALSDLMPELIGLKRPGETQAIHSWEHYLALDRLAIQAIPNYGDITWLWNKVAIHHGEVVRGGSGKTTKTVAKNSQYSEIFGHVHRLEHHIRTVHGPEGIQYVHAMTPGCLCKIDGEVPGVSSRPDWQQGFGVVYLVDGQVHMQAIPIQEGAAVFQNTVYRGSDQTNQIAKETGWHQFRPFGSKD